MRQLFKYLFFTLFGLFVQLSIAFAAGPPGPPGGGGPPGDCWPPPCVPIDGGVSILIAAGILYGGKKIYENRK